MYLTAQQTNRLRNIIGAHTNLPVRDWSSDELARYRALLTSHARRGTLTHEQSLIMAGFAVAMVDTTGVE